MHVRALVGTDTGALDVAGQSDPDPSTQCGHLGTESGELLPPDERLDLLKQSRVVAGVVLQLAAVLEDQPLVVGELVGLDEVDRADLRAVLAEVRRDGIHRPLHHVAALRPAGPSVGGDHHGVGVERLEDDAVVVGLVGTEQLGRGDDRHDQAVRDVGAVVVPELHVEAEQSTVVVEADLDVVHLPTFVGGGDEVLAPVLGELHRPAERPSRERNEDLLRPRVVDLDSEPTADVGRDHVDLAQVESELDRHSGADAGGGLRRGPHLQPVDVGVPTSDRAPSLERRRGAALDGQVELEAVRRGSHGGRRVTDVLLHPGADVAGDVFVDQPRGRPRVLDAHDGFEQLVVDPDQVDGVLGHVAVVRHDERDGFTYVVDLVLRERVLRAAVGQGRVRDQQRQRIGHRAREVLMGPHGMHPIEVQHPLDVDVDDLRVGVRRAQYRGVKRARRHGDVVDVPASAAEEALVLDALDPGPEELAGHVRSPSVGSAASSAARPTAFTMFW